MWFFRVWVPLAVAVTLLCALLYGVMQQSYRHELNDPQIQIAQDVGTLLLLGAEPTEFSTREPVDISRSLSPWFAIYDDTGAPITATGFFDGAMPLLPAEIFEAVRTAETTVTPSRYPEARRMWRPDENVSQALVIVRAGERFVAAGRNTREADQRMWDMRMLVAVGWIVTLGATLLSVWYGSSGREFIRFVSE